MTKLLTFEETQWFHL